MPSNKELKEIRENILKQEMNKRPALKGMIAKETVTKFGKVHNKLLILSHVRRLRKGEILAQWIRDKSTGKKEQFVWLGLIEKCVYDPVNLGYKIHYRPFVLQNEKEKEREEQLYLNQTR